VTSRTISLFTHMFITERSPQAIHKSNKKLRQANLHTVSRASTKKASIIVKN